MEQIRVFKTVKEKEKSNRKMLHPLVWTSYAGVGPIFLFAAFVILYAGMCETIYESIPFSLRCQQDGIIFSVYKIFYTSWRLLYDFLMTLMRPSDLECVTWGFLASTNAFNALLVSWYLHRKTGIKKELPWWAYGIIALATFLCMIVIVRFFWYVVLAIGSILIVTGKIK